MPFICLPAYWGQELWELSTLLLILSWCHSHTCHITIGIQILGVDNSSHCAWEWVKYGLKYFGVWFPAKEPEVELWFPSAELWQCEGPEMNNK